MPSVGLTLPTFVRKIMKLLIIYVLYSGFVFIISVWATNVASVVGAIGAAEETEVVVSCLSVGACIRMQM
jgi:hypothetical protein